MIIYTDSTFNNLNYIRSKSIKNKTTSKSYKKKLIQFIKFNLFDVFIHSIDEMCCNCVSLMTNKISLCISVFLGGISPNL